MAERARLLLECNPFGLNGRQVCVTSAVPNGALCPAYQAVRGLAPDGPRTGLRAGRARCAQGRS